GLFAMSDLPVGHSRVHARIDTKARSDDRAFSYGNPPGLFIFTGLLLACGARLGLYLAYNSVE
ncbi:hypothetical protein, partial [Aeromonas sp. SCS5]|uniref:hypothetical protein n=1 Tax=Aeromonas sp. SCS5 TaxID=1519205 RepID=UPI00195E5BE1